MMQVLENQSRASIFSLGSVLCIFEPGSRLRFFLGRFDSAGSQSWMLNISFTISKGPYELDIGKRKTLFEKTSWNGKSKKEHYYEMFLSKNFYYSNKEHINHKTQLGVRFNRLGLKRSA